MAWQDRVPFVTDGQDVAAGVTNQGPIAIDANTRYLLARIEALQLGSAVFDYNQPVEADALPGMAVWYNPSTSRFERALAGTQTDPVSQLLVPTPASYVAGIVFDKPTATSADILVLGLVNNLDMSQAITDVTPAGLYYLSTATPGMLVSASPPASVPVLWVRGRQIMVVPQIPNFLEGHKHYSFDLVAAPAGDTVPPTPGDVHIITSPDPSQPGWLPAGNAIFNGLAPAGAQFGYNLSKAGALKHLWPPVPLVSVILTKSSGDGSFLATVPATLIQFDTNGIWWMSDCYGEVPWPTDLNSDASVSISDEPCPVVFPFDLVLWFTQLDFLTANSVVTSLRSKNAALDVTCLSTGLPATTGDLELDLNLDFVVGQTDLTGFSVIKQLVDQTFGFGPVLEGLWTDSSNVTLSSATTRHLDPHDDTSPILYQGATKIEVTTDPTLEIPIELIRLGGVKEIMYQGVLYLAFLSGVQSFIIGKIRVPADLSISSPHALLRAVLLGRASGTLPQLTVSYLLQHRPANGLVSPVALLTSPTSLTMPTVAAVSLNQYVEAASDTFAVSPGDMIFFTISRSNSDAYSSEVGLMDLSCLLAGG